MTKAFRLSMSFLALLIGLGIVLILSVMGKKTRGPLENLFSYTGDKVNEMENSMIIQQREDKRSDKLKWLDTYKSNIAVLRNPQVILTGAYDNNTKDGFSSIIDLEDSLRTIFPIIHIYTAWGGKTEELFPTLQVKSIIGMGSIPLITWEPWLTDFDPANYPQLRPVDKRDKGGMHDVANGVYDFYIKAWADEAKSIKSPVMLRVGHEMNDPYRYPWGPQNNTAKDFIAAWRHIHDVFVQQGATNIIWVWSPHPAYGYFKDFYPGDAYVDYVGVGVLNYGTVASWSKWWSFEDIFGKHYKELAVFNKPIMITEFGSLAVGGNRSQWFASALDSMPQKYPAVKSVVFFHYSDDKTTTQQTINWYFKDDTASVKAISSSIKGWKKQ
ncbi:MAG TPA: glycosyl hydrolase [Chitinophagales bacterium]|nr:glycosyl hydrolase [Chitinophagales bacterium]